LPTTVLLRGQLGATGPPVRAVTAQIAQLRPLLGRIGQPSNELIDIGNKFKADMQTHRQQHIDPGREGRPSRGGGGSGLSAGGAGTDSAAAFAQVQKLAEMSPEEALEDEDYRRTVVGCQEDDLLVTDLLITRLGCEASKKVTRHKDGKKTVYIERKPRMSRFNVKHVRQVADGLYIEGMEGRKARLQLPDYLLTSDGPSPSLFLSLPDAIAEFKRWFNRTLFEIKLTSRVQAMVQSDANQPFTHLSKFVFVDQRSATDVGSMQKFDVNGDTSALDELGRLYPDNWLWHYKG
jgi:hypothetical protein